MGVEFTYLLNKRYPTYGDVEGYAYKVEYSLIGNLSGVNKKFNFLEVHNDCGVVEVDSPIFKTLGGMQKFFSKLNGIAKNKHGLATHNQHKGSGGGHIHVGMPKKFTDKQLLLFLLNIRRDMGNRPYLNYIFNEYCDDHTSNHYILERPCYDYDNFLNPNLNDFEQIIGYYKEQSDIGRWYDTRVEPFKRKKHSKVRKEMLNLLYGGECYTRVNNSYETVEFRIFDMPHNAKDLEDHIKFVDRYMRYIEKISKKGILIKSKVLDEKQTKKYCRSFSNKAKTKREFKAFLSELKLDYKDYSRFYKRNFLTKIDLNYKLR